MKLHNAHKETKGDKVKYVGQWRDQMRRPARVTISIDKGVDTDGAPEVYLEGSSYDTANILHAIANIAWNEGWRPGGLTESINSLIGQHKLPE